MVSDSENKKPTTVKTRVAGVSILANVILISLKIVASVITGSVGIMADAVHSIIDLSGVIVGYVGIQVAAKPPDEEHAFGHGKAENIASVVIASLIFVAAGLIVYRAIQRMLTGSVVEMVTLGIIIMAADIVIYLIVSRYALRVARATDSLALEAIGRDLVADVLSSCAVLVGLILVRITGLNILDPVVALLVAALIARTAFVTMKKSFGGLIDTRLPEAEEAMIMSCINEYKHQVVGFHELRTRKAGNQRYIDLHMVMSKDINLDQAHGICDQIEDEIRRQLPESSITIHVEPCDDECQQCSVICSRQQATQ